MDTMMIEPENLHLSNKLISLLVAIEDIHDQHHPAPERSSEKEVRKVLPRDPSLLKNSDARDFGNQAPRHDPRDGSVERTPARLHLPSQSMPRQDVPTTQILSQLLNALPRCPFGASNFGYCVAS